MSEIIKNEIKDFLKGANLSNYEVNVYVALLNSDGLTAREISEKRRILLRIVCLCGDTQGSNSGKKGQKTGVFTSD